MVRRHGGTHHVPHLVGGDPAIVDLVDGETGRSIGTLTGVDLPITASSTGLAAWVEKDDLEVERIVVRRLPEIRR